MSISGTPASESTKAKKYVVHIFESPSADELLEERQDRAALREVLRQAGIQVRTCLVPDQNVLVKAFAQLFNGHEKGVVPILHLSAHGNRDGIGLTSRQRVTWRALGLALELTNAMCDGELLLCMSTCEGFAALKMVTRETRAPFHTLVGPVGAVAWQDALVAFVSFYHLVISKGVAPEAAALSMSNAAGLSAGAFASVTGELLRSLHPETNEERAQRMASFAEAILAALQRGTER